MKILISLALGFSTMLLATGCCHHGQCCPPAYQGGYPVGAAAVPNNVGAYAPRGAYTGNNATVHAGIPSPVPTPVAAVPVFPQTVSYGTVTAMKPILALPTY